MLIQKERLRTALDLRPGEGSLVGLLLLHSLLQGVALAYFFTAANALFLERLHHHDISSLAWTYVAAGVLSALFATIYSRLEHSVSFERLLQWSVIALVPIVLLLRVMLEFADPFVIAFMLLVWYHVMHYLIDSRFWELSAVLFDVRQGKRLFGMVSLGEAGAKVLGYLSVPLLVHLAGTENLLLFAAAALMLALPALRRMLQRYGDRLATVGAHAHGEPAHGGHPAGAHGGHDAAQSPRLADRRYFLLLLFFTLFSFSALIFLEFGFLTSVEERFVHDGEIAPFLGVFFGVGKALNILSRAFLSGRFIRRYGLLVGLALLPSILLVLTLAIIGVPMLSSSERLPLLLFGLTVLISEVLRGPVANTAYLVLFQPLPPKRRLDAHTLAKAKGEPIAMVAAGLILIAITGLSGPLFYVSIGLALLMLGWIVVSVLLEKEYVKVVGDSLRKRVLRGSSLELADPTTMQILETRVRSSDPAEAIYALSLMAQGGHEKVEEVLLELAMHESPIVRREALRRIDEAKLAGAAGVLEEMIVAESDERLRGYAVTVYCVVAGERAIGVATSLLDDPTPEVASGAMIGLLRNGGLQGVIVAGERLMAMTTSDDPALRARAARVIGKVGNAGFYHPLLPLFADDDRRVSDAAIRASGAVGNPALIDPLVDALAIPRDAEPAAAALVRSGSMALPALARRFAASDDPRVLRRICRIAERIGGDDSLAILAAGFIHPRREVRDQAVTSIAIGAWALMLPDPAPALDAVRLELADAAVLLMELRQVSTTYAEAAHAVDGALRYELERLRGRLLLLLSLAFDRGSILRARDRLNSHDPALRANAIEILEISLPRSLVEQVMPLIEERDLELQYASVAAVEPHEKLEAAACLEEMIFNDAGRHSAWTRACALRLAHAQNAFDVATYIPRLLASRARVVWETAAEILREADGAEIPSFGEGLDAERREAIAHLVGINEVQTRNTMISTIEKVMTLKLTDMFSETPEEILTDVAEAMQEIYVPQGEEIIRKGEPGNCMYIIHEGSVRVHDGEHEFGRFGARDHFGELSLLDPEPRSASVTTLEDSHLLRLDQDALYEIMADSVEVARGILRNLTRRLRAQNQLIVSMEKGEGG
jgi:ATP:ADP antiporter, AAA family